MKVQKSIRLDANTASKVEALQYDAESFSAVCERLILAGMDALEGGGGGGGGPQPQADYLLQQLEAKDRQISELMALVSQGQQLVAIAAQRPTLAQRFRALIGRGGGDDGR